MNEARAKINRKRLDIVAENALEVALAAKNGSIDLPNGKLAVAGFNAVVQAIKAEIAQDYLVVGALSKGAAADLVRHDDSRLIGNGSSDDEDDAEEKQAV